MNYEKLKACLQEVNKWPEDEREFFIRAITKGWPIDLNREELAEFAHHLFTDKKRNPQTKGICSEYKGAGISPVIWGICRRVHKIGGKPTEADCEELLKQMNYNPIKYRGIWADMNQDQEGFMEELESTGEMVVIRPTLESAMA